MDRRSFIAAGGALGAWSMLRSASGATQRQPNIVFILADDLGYADLACYGRRDIATPNLDRLAAEGVRMLQAYANSPVCSATRTALITGRYQYRLRVGLEEPLRDAPDIGLPAEHPTLPSLLKRAGYSTTLVGKWHLGALPNFGPLQSGYEHFYGFRGGAVDYYTHTNPKHQRDLWEDDTPLATTGYMTDLLGDRAVAVIDSARRDKKPFFMSVHFSAPHWPWEAPGDQAEAQRLLKNSLFHHDGGSIATYRRMVERMDTQVGRILGALDAAGLGKDTIVIFTSDNGGERFSDTWPFTGKKTELLEGGVRVPAIIRWPAHLGAGKTSNQVAMSMDWLPTLLAAAGTAPDAKYPADGIDLLPYLTGAVPAQSRQLYWRYRAHAQRSMRDGDFKVLKILGNTFLFNVVDDPLERVNLKERHRDIYDRMTRAWSSWNAAMLQETVDAGTGTLTAAEQADQFGRPVAMGAPDDPTLWP